MNGKRTSYCDPKNNCKGIIKDRQHIFRMEAEKIIMDNPGIIGRITG